MAKLIVLVVAIFSLSLGTGCVRSAAREIHENGGSIVNYGAPIILPHADIGFDAEKKKLNDEDFQRLFPSIRRLRPYGINLEDSDVGDDSISYVKKLPTLVFLYVAGTPVTMNGLKQLEGMKNLKGIWLSGYDFTAQDEAELERNLSGVDITRVYKHNGEWWSEALLRSRGIDVNKFRRGIGRKRGQDGAGYT